MANKLMGGGTTCSTESVQKILPVLSPEKNSAD